MDSGYFFVENLTIRGWLVLIWPHLLGSRLRGGYSSVHCHVVDSSGIAFLLAKVSAWIIGVAVEKLVYRLIDVRDEAGLLIRLRVAYKDLAEVQQAAMTEPVFQGLVESEKARDRLPMYLAKNIGAVNRFDRGTMWRVLVLIQVCLWKTKHDVGATSRPVLFLEHRAWLKAISQYASAHGLTVVPVFRALSLARALRRRLPPNVISALRSLRYTKYTRWRLPPATRGIIRRSTDHTKNRPGSTGRRPASLETNNTPRIAVAYAGHLNLSQPALHSDLFFWQQSELSAKDLIVTFANPLDPLDGQKWSELMEHGMSAVVLHPGATTVPDAPVFVPNLPDRVKQVLLTDSKSLESKWLNEQLANYHALRSYWVDCFAQHNIKVYTSWFKYTAHHCAIADALQSLGGVTAIYQRAFESEPSAETTIGADIVFGFSQAVAEVERRSNSTIRYHVTVGYLGDHRFSLCKDIAQTARQTLQQHGATHVMAYFDENSGEDERWHTGHEFMRMNYSFLLQKVQADPLFGLLIKPKTPRTLRSRLGSVAKDLERAEATGRCYVYEEGHVQGSHPPVEAALAADMVVHGHLCSATAGVEAALAGVPTLLLDREGWGTSPLYRLGPGQVVFNDWESLWTACLQNRESSHGVPGLGDWSPLLDEIDPFRDGRAAERMGTYLQWLIEGFRAGHHRETVMADAAQRYCQTWGDDKITEVAGTAPKVNQQAMETS